MKGKLIRHSKIIEDGGGIIEIRLWQVESSPAKPHGYKYSLVYVVSGTRIIGYDNAEEKGDHRHYRDLTEQYEFKNLGQLANDFHRDIERYKKGLL